MSTAVLESRTSAPRTAFMLESAVVNPFIIAAVSVIRDNTGLSVARENVFLQKGKFTPAGTGMALDITGDLKGKIVFEFSKGVAARVSQRMVERQIDMAVTAVDFKDMLNAAILELGNQISGKAITLLERAAIRCSISPPQFFLGRDLQLIHPHLVTLVLVLRTEFGEFSINVAVQRT